MELDAIWVLWIRESVIDFTTTYMEEGVGIITKRPQEESNKEYKMFKPLSVMVWIGIAITIIFIGICLCLVNRFSPFSDNTDDEKKDMTNSFLKIKYNCIIISYSLA
jgi:hypothetical protein